MTGVKACMEEIKRLRLNAGFSEDEFEIYEVDAKPIFDQAPKPKPIVEVRFNPHIKTDYYEHIDGFNDTDTYFLGCLHRILNGLSLPEYNEEVAAARKIRYTVGNFVVCTTRVNPLITHTSLYLPFKVDIVKGKRRWK